MTPRATCSQKDEAMQDRIQDILAQLIAFPSVSDRSNLDIVAFIEAYLRSEGIESVRIASPEGDKASLFATIGDARATGLVLSAHTDVVPADEPGWSTPPFAATLRDGRIYGRGATDMKGFLAIVLAAVPLLRRTECRTPVHLAFSYDEEVGCRGAPAMVERILELAAPPALAIVGEPTGMRVARAHKGKLAWRAIVTGRAGHSALPHRAANAVEAAAAIAAGLRTLGRELERTAPAGSEFDPPWTSVHVGSLHGGGALNLVPDRAVIEFEIRMVPGTDAGGLTRRIDGIIAEERAALKARAPEADIAVEPMIAYPALDTPAGSAALAAAARLAGDCAPPATVAFGTEAGIYAAAGIPTVICGPGDIGRAHKADEWIGLDELAAAAAMMERLAGAISRPAEEWIGA
jgi:acetylornithine deacetylase